MQGIFDSEDKIELKDEERTRCEIWTRVMGYYRPVSNFNKGKQSEYFERKYFNVINNGTMREVNKKRNIVWK